MNQQNSLVRIEPRGLTLTQMCEYADVFIKSGIFKDATSQAQAVVKIMAGQELGLEPFAAMSELHIIDGKVTQSAGLLAKKIKNSGVYDFRIETHNDTICTITMLRHGDVIGVESLALADAVKRGLTTEWSKTRNQTVDKTNWKKHPKNMLFARVISNAVKFYCPEVTGGIVAYTHGEIDEPIEAEFTSEPTQPEPKTRKAKAEPKPGRVFHMVNGVEVEGLPPEEKAIQDAESTRIAQEQGAVFRAELKAKEEEDLRIAAQKRAASDRFKKLSVTAPDQKLIWSELDGNLDEIERFLTIFPGKVPLVVDCAKCLEIWREHFGVADTALIAITDYGKAVAQEIAGKPEPPVAITEAPPALPNGFVEVCQTYEIALPERAIVWKAFGSIQDAEDFFMLRTSKDVPASVPIGVLIQIWKETDGHLRKSKVAVAEFAASNVAVPAVEAPEAITPAKRSLKNDNPGFDSSPVWKWIKTSGLDATEPNRKRINQIMELNSHTIGDKLVYNWQAIVHQIKTEFSA